MNRRMYERQTVQCEMTSKHTQDADHQRRDTSRQIRDRSTDALRSTKTDKAQLVSLNYIAPVYTNRLYRRPKEKRGEPNDFSVEYKTTEISFRIKIIRFLLFLD